MGWGDVLILIPLIFLTGLRGFIGEFHPNEDMNDAGVFMLIGFVFVLATASLVVPGLYHALMESSECPATRGKKALGLVVTDMAAAVPSFVAAPRNTCWHTHDLTRVPLSTPRHHLCDPP